ncbi:MAG: DNA-3-methyladenine glycosylase 2 family protein [Kangiellaceae bacterium]|nr:DNA-3-methyladenine glycosylase 2 family protein [Kangiellaceae bacterium]
MKHYQTARKARDVRYDGKFFVAVKTTKIYCRPVCPAPSPKESNVSYYSSAIQAERAGYRPCLRCRPESAPYSAAWLGNQALLRKAMNKIEAGELNQRKLPQLAESMGISDRYLRKLFQQHLGVSPIHYANHVRLMFAKQLLHESELSITQVAFSSGFNSLRRFNDAFKQTMRMSPSALRHKLNNLAVDKDNKIAQHNAIRLKLNYRPPYNWPMMQNFLQQREINCIENITRDSYQRTFRYKQATGQFKATHIPTKHQFQIELEIDNLIHLMAVTNKIRQVLDLNSDLNVIEKHLTKDIKLKPLIKQGLRLPACWDAFEAGVKAILGQQVSVKAAYGHTSQLIEELGSTLNDNFKLFPTAQQVMASELDFLRMPQSRKQTLKNFAQWYINNQGENLESILNLKGIGPWTYEYIKLRSGTDSDAYPEKDLGVIKALEKYQLSDPQQWSPWRSYATLHLWNSI